MTVALSVLSLVGLLTATDDATLYAPAPPPNSAFVRVLHAGAGAEPAKVGTVALGAVESAAASAYAVAPSGELVASLGAQSHTLRVAAGGYYSVAWPGGTPTVFKDVPHASRTKALITVYNVSDLPTVALTTADGSIEVVGGVAVGTSGRRELNALAVPLVIRGPSGVVADLGEQVLERGAAYQVVVTGSGTDATALWGRSQTRP